MKRKSQSACEAQVVSPSKGIVTRIPSNETDPSSLSAGENIRCMDGTLQNAPGYETMGVSPVITANPLLIFQGSLTAKGGNGTRQVPILFCGDKIYSITRAVNKAPVVYAGPDVDINASNFYDMVATATDFDGDPLTYQWDLISCPAGQTSYFSPTILDPSVVVTGPGDYVFRLTVSDGTDKVTDTVTISFVNLDPNIYYPVPPVTFPSFTQPGCGDPVNMNLMEGFTQYTSPGAFLRYLGSVYEVLSINSTTQITVRRRCDLDPNVVGGGPGPYAIPPGEEVPTGGGTGYPNSPTSGGMPNPGPGEIGDDLDEYKDYVDDYLSRTGEYGGDCTMYVATQVTGATGDATYGPTTQLLGTDTWDGSAPKTMVLQVAPIGGFNSGEISIRISKWATLVQAAKSVIPGSPYVAAGALQIGYYFYPSASVVISGAVSGNFPLSTIYLVGYAPTPADSTKATGYSTWNITKT